MSSSAGAADSNEDLGGISGRTRPSAPVVGRLQTVTGPVTISRPNGVVVQSAIGDLVFEGDLIETGNDGLVAIRFVDGTTFFLHADAHLVLDEFACDREKSSALLRVVKGVFSFVAGKLATSGRLIIDTPVARIRSTASGAGIGSLALTALTFSLIRELKAASADVVLLDDGAINYKDLKHGVFEIVTKGDHPQVIIVDDPGKSIIIRPRGSGYSVQQIANSPAQMALLHSDYQGALGTFLQGQEDLLFSIGSALT